jgi:hypothetical protein
LLVQNLLTGIPRQKVDDPHDIAFGKGLYASFRLPPRRPAESLEGALEVITPFSSCSGRATALIGPPVHWRFSFGNLVLSDGNEAVNVPMRAIA